MKRRLALLSAAVVWTAGAVSGTELKTGTPEVKSISAIAFGPNGTLFVGDSTAGTVVAIDTADTKAGGQGDVNVEKLGDKLGSALGTTKDKVTVNDVKVNPASGNIFIAATRQGAGGGPVLMKLDRDGKIAEFALKDVPFAAVKLPAGEGGTSKGISFTSLAFVNGKVIVAGLSNEQFASTLWTVPYPFAEASRGTGIEIFHGAHGKLETRSPIQTFTPYQISGADYIMAAYTCTPLVKIPVADLKAGAQVKGTTIAELGNGNKPLDMVVYQKDGKDFVLIANNVRGVMKLPADGFANAQPITTQAKPKTGIQYEPVDELKGVVHLDKLDANRALILVQDPPPPGRNQPPLKDYSLTLKSVPLP